MKTFQEFLEEGKKKLAKRIQTKVNKSLKKQQKENPDKTPVADYGHSAPNSTERDAAIMAMMKNDAEGRKRLKSQMPNDDNH